MIAPTSSGATALPSAGGGVDQSLARPAQLGR